MDREQLIELSKKAQMRDLSDPSALNGLFDVVRLLLKEDKDEALRLNQRVRGLAAKYAVENKSVRMFDLYEKSLLLAAPYDFDSYMLYTEKNRQLSKRFYQPRRKQLLRLTKEMQRLADREIELLAISLPPGVGKALADDTPILTRNGWKNHGDLVVGDEVIGMDGKFKKVIAVHPKCMLDCLVEFTNGEKIQCHENHEWMIYDRRYAVRRNTQDKHIRILETKEIEKRKLDHGKRGTRGHKYYIGLPRRNHVVGEEKDLPLDPYTFGVWLGDGTNRSPRICCDRHDVDIVRRIEKNGNKIQWNTVHKDTGVLYFGFGFRSKLRKMGMCNSQRRLPKYIPDEYLTASVDQRLQLLAGLLDTDGCLSGNKYTFCTSEKTLLDSFISLISTFGWRGSVDYRAPELSTSCVLGKHGYYRIGFTPDVEIPCALERKQNKNPTQQRMISIESIRRVKAKQGNCITVEGDGMYLAGHTMLPTHNTTLALFFLTWLAGRNPEKPMLTGSHANSFLTGVYGEILRMLDPNGEYLWQDVFPGLKVISTNAKDMMIDVGHDKREAKRFSTLEFTSVGSGNAGKVRAENLLYCDDLVDGLESALSRDRMDKLWGLYSTDLRQRKIGDCVELHIATRWSVHDVIGRLEQMYGDNGKSEFIAVPALDENDESLFDYPIEAGLSTKFLHEQREAMDDASWRALYLNQPIEREGLLCSEQELRRYFELPDGEPDAIISVCDTKDRGTDYCVMPIAYQYGQDFYIDGVICDNSNPEIVEPRLISACLEHRIQMSRFESNSAGGKIAEKIQNGVKEKGGRTKITTKFTTANKETKIIVNSPWWKEHCLFKDDSVIKGDKEYKRFLNFLCSYTMMGKNKWDDVPDAMAQLAEYAQSFTGGKVEVFTRPW